MDQNPAPDSEKKKLHIKLIITAILFLGLLFLYFGWVTYWSPNAKRALEYQEKVEKVEQAMTDFETAMRNDTYGGKTPEETLAMFIDALKKGDVDLACKYFILETNTQSPNYLTRNEWTSILIKTRNEKGFDLVIKTLETAKPSNEEFLHEGDYKFFVENSAYINMERNKYSEVWKIESM